MDANLQINNANNVKIPIDTHLLQNKLLASLENV